MTMSFFHDRRCEHGGFGMIEINCMFFLSVSSVVVTSKLRFVFLFVFCRNQV